MTTEQRISGAEAARILGVSRTRVGQLAREGRIPCEVTALGRLYSRSDVDAFKASRDSAAEAAA